jgi:NAD(P)-dependent dehydrogenase (short-subunit alcohol dehydrogenase family)
MFAVQCLFVNMPYRRCSPALAGVIANISAGKALRGEIDTTAYSASKAALNVLTRFVATIYGERGIRCNAIAPGPISTELVNSIIPPAVAEILRDCTLLGELGDPEDIADLAVFLVSKRSKFITAQVIQCDGGTFDHNPVRYGLRKLSIEDPALRPVNSDD